MNNQDTTSCNYQQGKHMRDSLMWGLILGAVFIVLRLTGVIAWSWWAVTAPFWSLISQGILVLITAIFVRNQAHEARSAYFGLSGIVNIFVVFFVLRLLGVIGWSWGIIAIPLWVGAGLMIITAFGFSMKKRVDKQKQDT